MRKGCLLFLVCFASHFLSAQRVFILGIAQDGGYPHIGCKKACCREAFKQDSLRRFVVSFALVDTTEKKWWLFEATPDITEQLYLFRSLTDSQYSYLPAGIFITHAHIGHYTGLMYLGKEALGSKEIPVHVLPKMASFLQTNGPWSQLVSQKNITLKTMQADSVIRLSPQVSVEAFTVPHRDEYSETAGFRIVAGKKRILFIPDIDKWEKWNRSIVQEVKRADIALLDATFGDSKELPPGRVIREVPHPLVSETMALFESEKELASRIYFIHFNHTNRILWDAKAGEQVEAKGFHLAQQGQEL